MNTHKPATFAVAPLTLGFIGGSLESAVGYTHFVSSTMDNQWSLVAGCFSTDAQLNQDAARAYGVASDRVYDNWQDMLDKESGRTDTILVLTPTPSHSEVVAACLRAGFAVICEKSLAANSTEAQHVLNTQNAENGFLAVTFNYSGYPMVRELRARIGAGTLGRILHFQAEMPQEGFIRVDAQGNKPTPQAWRLMDSRIPTIHLDLAVHLHHMIYYLTGQKPVEVVSHQDSYGWFPEIIDNVVCLCRYSKNIQGQLWFSKSALGHRNGLRLRIYGSKAAAEWFQANPEELILSYQDGRREIVDRASSVTVANLKRYNRFKAGHPSGFIEAFANLYSDIADCLRQHKSSGSWRSEEVFGAELALEGLHFLEAMTASAAKREWQMVGGQLPSVPVITAGDDVASVRQFVINAISKKARLPESCTVDQFNYIDSGHVDSLGIIKFVAAIESKFDIEILESDIESAEFRTIGGLVSIIRSKISAKGYADRGLC